MSNAMRSGKRLLAGVAASALGAGMLVGLASAPAANAVIVAAQTGIAAPTVGSNYISTAAAGGITTTGIAFADETVTLNFQISGAPDDTVSFTLSDKIFGAAVTSGAASAIITGDDSVAFQLAGGGIATATITLSPTTVASGPLTPTIRTAESNNLNAATLRVIARGTAKATQGATSTTPVRAASTPSSVPFGRVVWNNASGDDTIADDSNIVFLTDAPAGAVLTVGTGSVSVGQPGGNVSIDTDPSTGLQYFEVKATLPGRYTGYIQSAMANTRQRAFSFTTTGVPASMTLTPASTVAAQGQSTLFTVQLLDSSGNRTQPASLDSIALSASPAGTPTWDPAGQSLSAASLFAGVAEFSYANAALGSYSVTATPLGTLTVGAQSASVSVSGSISDDSVSALAVSVPANALNTGSMPTVMGTIPAGTGSVTVSVAGAANTTVRFKITAPTAGVVNGVAAPSSFFTNVTLGANGTTTIPLTLGGAALTSGQNTTVAQIEANGDPIAGTQPTLTIAPATPAINNAVISPSGALVATLGQPLTVTALVANQFSVPAGNYTVAAYRGSYATAPITTSVTGTDGVATLPITNAAGAASGAVETYLFRITSPGGVINNVTSTLTVTWLSNPTISSVTDVTSPATVITNGVRVAEPLILVPGNGLVNTAQTGYTINPVTGVTAPDADFEDSGKWFSVTVSSAPATNLVVTAPEGVKLLRTAPSAAAPALWSAGSQSLTVGSGTTVYVFATKTGSHKLTVVPAGLTAPSSDVEFTVANVPSDAYSVSTAVDKVTVPVSGIGTFKATVKDVFGNNVPYALVEGTATGPVLLSGLTTSGGIQMGANGEATVAIIALSQSGEGKVDLGAWTFNTLSGYYYWNAAAPGFTPPPGASAPVLNASVAVTVSGRAGDSIVIVGQRGTGSENNMIFVDGKAAGMAGKTVTPYIRFPGETGFTAGSGTRTVSADGDFSWQRKTGKRTAVEFRGDGQVSNRIIIPAR